MSQARERKVHEALAAACFASADAIASDLPGFFERGGVSPSDAEVMGKAAGRVRLYRRLVQNNFRGVVQKMMPRTRARVNAHGNSAFDASFVQFLHEQGPRTHYLRDVPHEFLRWVTPRWPTQANVPPYACDLAAHELAEFAMGAFDSNDVGGPMTDLSLDQPLVFASAKRIMHYDYAVHELSEDEADLSEPSARKAAVLVYRDAEHGVRSIELSGLQAAILEALFASVPLAEAIRASALVSPLSADLTASTLRDIAELLATLGEHGLLLGAPV